MIEQRVTLRYGAQQIPAIVQAVQGDTGRDVIFELADYEIPAGATANYYIDKPDDTAIYNSAEVISSTEILAHLTEQALAAPGRNNGQVRILSDGDVITSFDFVLEVEAFRGILRLQSETEVNIFDRAIEDAVNTATEEAVAEIQAQTPVVTGMQNSIAPTYSSSSTYAVGDYVMYNAQLYRCVTAISTAEPWTAIHWQQVPLANKVNDINNTLKSVTLGEQITFSGTAGTVNKFHFSIVKNVKYLYTNNMSAIISVSLYKADSTSKSLAAALGAGMSVEFIADDDYDQIGGWFNENGTATLTVIGLKNDIELIDEELKQNIINEGNGILNFGLFSNFIHGNIYLGNINQTILNRIVNEDIIAFDVPVTVTCKNGFWYKLNLYDSDNVYQSEISARSTAYTIEAGTRFRTCIGRSPEVSTEVANVAEYINAVTFKSENGKFLELVNNLIPYIFDFADFDMEQNGITGGFDFVTSKQVRTSSFTYLPKGSSIVFGAVGFQRLIYIYGYTYPKQDYYYIPVPLIIIGSGENDEFTVLEDGFYRFSIAKGSNADITPEEVAGKQKYIISKHSELSSEIANDFYGMSYSLMPEDTSTKLQQYANIVNENESDNYVFFTDPHLMGNSGTFSKMFLNKYLSVLEQYFTHFNFRNLICGGDWLNTGDTPQQAKYKLAYITGLMSKIYQGKYHQLVGNHDTNAEGGTAVLNQEEIETVYGDYETGKCYYRFTSTNTAYFVLDTGRTDDDTLTTYRIRQLYWLCEKLVSENKDHIVIIYHAQYSTDTNITLMAAEIGNIISAYNSRSSYTIAGATYDFSNATHNIEYTLVGHTHADYETISGGRPLIGTVNFVVSNVASFDLAYCDYTAKKLYLIRVGSGADRIISLA